MIEVTNITNYAMKQQPPESKASGSASFTPTNTSNRQTYAAPAADGTISIAHALQIRLNVQRLKPMPR
jgi:hypothetical protein